MQQLKFLETRPSLMLWAAAYVEALKTTSDPVKAAIAATGTVQKLFEASSAIVAECGNKSAEVAAISAIFETFFDYALGEGLPPNGA